MSAELQLSQPLQRGFALFLLLIPITAAGLFIYGQVSAYLQHQERISLLTREMSALQGLTQGVPIWQAELAKLGAAGIADGLLFNGANANAASGDLQRQVTTIVTSGGGTVTRNVILTPEALSKDKDKLSVAVSFAAEAPSLVRILHGLEVARPLLRVARLTVHNPDGEAAITTPLTAPNKLQIDLLITSYRVTP